MLEKTKPCQVLRPDELSCAQLRTLEKMDKGAILCGWQMGQVTVVSIDCPEPNLFTWVDQAWVEVETIDGVPHV